MYTNHKHYILLISALISVCVTGIAYCLLYRSIISQASRAAQITAESALEGEKKRRAQDIASIYAKYGTERSRIENLLLSQEKIVDFIESLEKIGTTTDARIEITGIATEGEYLKLHVGVTGAWSAVVRTLALIENMQYALSLNDVRLRASTQVDRIWNLDFDVRVLTTK